MLRWTWFAFATGMLLLPASAFAGAVRGAVTLAGPRPATEPKSVTRDNRYCGSTQPDESLLLTASGAVQNVVVYLEDAAPVAPRAPLPPVKLDQVGCRYVPHVIAAQVGTTLDVSNSDPVLHNVNLREDSRTVFNVAFPLQGLRRSLQLDHPETLRAECNAGHPWMNAWIRVFDHPYFGITDRNGEFVLANVPPGTHSLAAWHERLGVLHARVTVTPQGARVDLTYR